MNKREYQRLLRRAALAYNLGSSEYSTIMDEASVSVDDWDQFCRDMDDAMKVPPTEHQKVKYQRQEKQKEIEDAKIALRFAQERLKEALKN